MAAEISAFFLLHFPAEKCGFQGAPGRKLQLQEGFTPQELRTLANFLESPEFRSEKRKI